MSMESAEETDGRSREEEPDVAVCWHGGALLTVEAQPVPMDHFSCEGHGGMH